MVQRRDRGRGLVARGLVVDADLGPDRDAGAGVALLVDPARTAVLALRAPHHHEVAARERRDLGHVLAVGGEAVDAELVALGRAVRREQPREHPVARAVARGRAVARDGDRDEAAVVQRGDPVDELVARGLLVDQLLAAHPRAGGVVALDEGAGARAVARRAGGHGGPADHEAAVRQRQSARLELAALGLGVDLDLGLGGDRRARRGVAAVEDAHAAAVEPAVVLPRDHEAAVGQPDRRRVGLGVHDGLVDAELGPDRLAVGVVALGEDAEIAVARVVLIDRLPDHDVAGRSPGHGVDQCRHHRVALSVRAHGVDGQLVAHRAGRVGLGGHLDAHHDGGGGGAVAVLELDRQRGGRARVVGEVLIGQVLEQDLDRLRVGVRVQRHDQRRAVGAVGGQRADHHAVHGDVGAAQRHRAGDVEAQLVLADRVLVGEVVLGHALRQRGDDQPPAVEIGAVHIRHRDRPLDVQPLRRGVHEVLGEHAEGRERLDLRRRADGREGRGVAQQALKHALARAVAGGPGGVGLERDHELPARQTGDVGRALVPLRLDVDPRLAGGGHAVGVEAPRHHRLAAEVVAGAGSAGEGVGGEGDDEAAVLGRRHARLELVETRGQVDLELRADRRPVALEHPREHARARAVEVVVVVENHDIAPARQPRDVGALLAARGGGVDQRLRAQRRAVQRIALREHALRVARPVAVPDHHESARRQRRARLDRRDRAVALRAGVRRVDAELRARRRAGVVVEPRQHVGVEAAAIAVGGEADHEAAARQPRDSRIGLRRGDELVDLELAAQRRCVGPEAAAVDAEIEVARIVLVARLPDHDEAAVLGGGDGRIALDVLRGDVDAEFGPDPLALRAVTLRKNPGLIAVLTLRRPDDDVIATRQRRHRRQGLIA